MAAAGRVQGRRQIAGQDDPLLGPFLVRVGQRHGGDQRPRIGVPRFPVQGLPVRDFHQPAQVQNHDPVTDMADDRQVVADEDQPQLEFRCSRISRLMICDWMETSSADTGSSQMTSFGLRIIARAMPMRWHWPPENSCG